MFKKLLVLLLLVTFVSTAFALNITEVINLMRQGRKFRLASWEEGAYIAMPNYTPTLLLSSTIKKFTTATPSGVLWLPTDAEFASTDYMEVTP